MTARHVTAPPGGWAPPWPLVVEVAAALPVGSWILVGGLMVQLHARASGVVEVRPTHDVDALVELGWPDAPVHRLRRSEDVIDILVADHLPKRSQPRLHRHPVMPADGGAQALARTQRVTIEDDGQTVELTVPDLLGALVLKGAAHMVDRRDPERHLRDAALLASLMTDHRHELTRLQGSDRKRLRHLRDALSDPFDDAWLLLPDDARLRGQDTLRILSA